MPIIIVAIAVLLSAGISFGAEQALPGDALYPVKTEVNERVMGWVAVSDESESKFQTRTALRRIEEANKLEAEGKLDAETKAELEADFKLHSDAALNVFAGNEGESGNEDSAKLRAEFEAAIREHGSIFTDVEEDNEDSIPEDDEDSAIDFDEDAEASHIVKTAFGDLALTYKDGKLKLQGELMRSTPCIEWKTEMVITKDMPPSHVTFRINKTSTAEICIQVLGKPQKIELETPAAETANITVIVAGETAFSGKLQSDR